MYRAQLRSTGTLCASRKKLSRGPRSPHLLAIACFATNQPCAIRTYMFRQPKHLAYYATCITSNRLFPMRGPTMNETHQSTSQTRSKAVREKQPFCPSTSCGTQQTSSQRSSAAHDRADYCGRMRLRRRPPATRNHDGHRRSRTRSRAPPRTLQNCRRPSKGRAGLTR